MRLSRRGWQVAGVGVVCAILAVPLVMLSLQKSRSARAGSVGVAAVGALEYEMGEGASRNPWIKLACSWPSTEPGEMEPLLGSVSENERRAFVRWAQDFINPQWLPEGFPEGVPCLEGWGLVSVKETPEYRVRVKIAHKPDYKDIVMRALVVAVEPLGGAITVPQTEDEIRALVSPFLRLSLSAGTSSESSEALASHFILGPGTAFLACRPPEAMALEVYGWTDGRILLIAVDTNEHYGTGGRPPVPQAEAVTPEQPTEEKIEIHSELTPEELANQRN